MPVAEVDMTQQEFLRRETVTFPKDATLLKCIRDRIGQMHWSNKRFNCYKGSTHFLLPKSAEASNENTIPDLDPHNDVLLTIQIYYPYKFEWKNKTFLLLGEYLVLGSQKLSEFRDAIKCSCDSSGPFTENSNDPLSNPRENDPFKDSNSGFFFIGNTFYNDMRNPNNVDISEPITTWASKTKSFNCGPFLKADMDKTVFLDLENLRLGYPYLYKHYGDCEHLFVISDIRIINEKDSLISSDYPYLRKIPLLRCKICDICGSDHAEFLVRDCNYNIFDPGQFCKKCHTSYHYVDDKKVEQFQSFKIPK